MASPHFAYIFERFPSFTQTFVDREVEALEQLGIRPLLFSIRDTKSEAIQHFPRELVDRVIFLPPSKELGEEVREWNKEGKLLSHATLTMRHWGTRPDKARIYEACWIAQKLQEIGGRPAAQWHVHSHFAGIGARTSWWLNRLFGASYSFTGHANDLFCPETAVPLTLELLVRNAASVLTVSDATVRDLKTRYPNQKNRIHRVYNGLNLKPLMEAAKQAALHKNTRRNGTIVSIGRLVEKKGFGNLIKACGLLRDAGVKFQCRIVGEGPLAEPLLQQIQELRLEDYVELTGPKTQQEIIHLLAEESQICALACTTEKFGGRDNLPTVLMEGMAAGLPCVSTRLAGVPEMIEHRWNGLISEENDCAAFARHLRELLDDPEQCRVYGHNGMERAQKLFDQNRTALQFVKTLVRCPKFAVDRSLLLAHPSLAFSYLCRLLRPFRSALKRNGRSFETKEGFDMDAYIND